MVNRTSELEESTAIVYSYGPRMAEEPSEETEFLPRERAIEEFYKKILLALAKHEDEIFELKERVRRLEEEIREMKIEKVIYVREVSKEEAKEMIIEYLKKQKSPKYDDEIAEDLQLDVWLVTQILNELEKEGIIE